MKLSKRVAIVYPGSNLDTVPSLTSMATLLAEYGYWVDIFTRYDKAFPKPTFENDRIAILPSQVPDRSERPARWRFLPTPMYWLLSWPLLILTRHWQAPYVCVIGVDPVGLVSAARAIIPLVRVPLVYYSLELMLSYELTTEAERELKAQERILSQRAAFVIIQDEERASLLVKDNDLSWDKIITVPNAHLGKANIQRSTYLREKFNIPPDTKIILHAGSIANWAGTVELIQSTQDWPDDWVLVCHTRFRADSRASCQGDILASDYISALRCLAKPNRVLFSTDPLTRHQYPMLVQSADVGVVFYCPQPGSIYQQDNLRYIGLSSGKLADYLQAGLPVLANSPLQRLISTYNCGEVTDDPAVTRVAIERILANYEAYSQNAVTCFNREFDFAGKFKHVLTALGHLALSHGKGYKHS